jgi:hypothetical protein
MKRGRSPLVSIPDLSDGSYARNRIYPVFGILGSKDQDAPIGTFFVQPAGNLCAYELPGGALAMSFNSVPVGAPQVLTRSCLSPTATVGISWKEPSS